MRGILGSVLGLVVDYDDELSNGLGLMASIANFALGLALCLVVGLASGSVEV